jgi:hypothetical protein
MPATLLAPVGLQGVSNLAAHRVTLYLSCTCSDRSTRSWLPRPCQLRRTSLLPLPTIRLQPPIRREGHGSWEELGLLLPGWPSRHTVQASSKRTPLTRSRGRKLRAFLARAPPPTSHTLLMHPVRAKPAVRKLQTSTALPRPCCNIPRRSRQLARHDVEIILTSLNLQGQSRGSVI